MNRCLKKIVWSVLTKKHISEKKLKSVKIVMMCSRRPPDMCKVILNFRFDILKKTTDKRAPPIRPRDFFIFLSTDSNC